ncbi:MAG: hypothetical protein HYX69_17480 [Planctomycetia bacterium]|nr:hypothetical protein [Planctomycetia bacterium]
MPEILAFYLVGLCLAAGVGLAFYYGIGDSIEAVVERVFGPRIGPLWGRTVRIQVVLMALVGGLATQFYGCGGYSDYKAVAQDRRLMLEKTTTQVASATDYAKWFLIGTAGISALVIAALPSRPAKDSSVTPRHPKAG